MVPNLEVYDLVIDRWETRAPMPQAAGGLGAVAVDGKLYVFGGTTRTGGNFAVTTHEVLVLPK